MQRGKISEIALKRSVFKNIDYRDESVIQEQKESLDASTINLEGITAVMSSNVIENCFDGYADFYINKTINNLYVKGAIPLVAQLAIIMPEDSKEQQLGKIMREMNEGLSKYGISISGGQTIVSSNVKKPVIMFTVIGKPCYDVNNLNDIKPGQQIVMTKSIAIGGTGIISKIKKEQLEKHYTATFVNNCISFFDFLSVKKEAESAIQNGATALHDVSTGGVFSAIWELTTPTGYGSEIFLEKIPVWQEAVEVAELFDVNPYLLDGTGALLIIADNGDKIVDELEKEGINASIIGNIMEGKSRVIINKDETRYLEPQRGDEIYKFI